MPNVPNLPGVPALSSYATAQVSLLVQDLVSTLLFGAGPQWGIFLNGFPVVAADSVIAVEYKQDYRISTYPVEQGGFESYDKVQVPFEIRLRMSAGGSETNRQEFLDSIDAIIGDFNLYDVNTPEKTYRSVTLRHQDFRRTASEGLGLISVEVTVEQLRVTGVSNFTNVASPTAASPVGGGAVTTAAPTTAQQNAWPATNNPQIPPSFLAGR